MQERLLSIGKAAKILGVCNPTLRRWEASGKLVPIRTPTNQRRYKLSDLKAIIGLPSGIETPEKDI